MTPTTKDETSQASAMSGVGSVDLEDGVSLDRLHIRTVDSVAASVDDDDDGEEKKTDLEDYIDNESLQPGDFVLIQSADTEHDNKRGYVLGNAKKGLRIALDECDDGSFLRICKQSVVIAELNLQLIRHQHDPVLLCIGGARDDTHLLFGMAAATFQPLHTVACPRMTVTPDSAYAMLPRLRIADLPPPPASLLASFNYDHDKHLYQALFRGKFMATLQHEFANVRAVAPALPSYLFTLLANDEDDGHDSFHGSGGGLVQLQIKTKVHAEHVSIKALVAVCEGTMLDMTVEQNQALMARAIHLVLRCASHDFGMRSVCMLASCVNWYHETARHEDILDVLLAVTDHAILTGQSSACICTCFKDIIKYFCDRQDYKQILSLSEHVLEKHTEDKDPHRIWYTRAVAVGYLLQCRHEMAAQALWLAIRLFFEYYGRKSIDDVLFHSLCMDLAHLMYLQKHCAVMDDSAMEVPYLFRSCCESAFSSTRSSSDSALAVKYHARNEAKKALIASLATAAAVLTVSDAESNRLLHSSVLGWKSKVGVSASIANSFVFIADVQDAYAVFEKVKLPFVRPGNRACHYAACISRKIAMLKCSRCKKAWYCARECQVAHWKAQHKAWCAP